MSKVFLALIDGMRPDSLTACNHPFFQELKKTSLCSMNMRSVMPSVTLPCHMSLFHSVCAERHGILTNTYVPQVREIKGLCEVLSGAGKFCSFFYSWENLRDLSRPRSLASACYFGGQHYTYQEADRRLTEEAYKMLQGENPSDFIFFYQCQVDEMGHKYSWMSEEYLQAVNNSLDNVQRLAEILPEDYALIVTADHGGHDRSHGSEMEEDMAIPVFIRHSSITPGQLPDNTRIIDIAPTITHLMDVPSDPDWEGRSLL
jgi:predicted AlkP superfamily pyrophosphatase or phosphodiesterase